MQTEPIKFNKLKIQKLVYMQLVKEQLELYKIKDYAIKGIMENLERNCVEITVENGKLSYTDKNFTNGEILADFLSTHFNNKNLPPCSEFVETGVLRFDKDWVNKEYKIKE